MQGIWQDSPAAPPPRRQARRTARTLPARTPPPAAPGVWGGWFRPCIAPTRGERAIVQADGYRDLHEAPPLQCQNFERRIRIHVHTGQYARRRGRSQGWWIKGVGFRVECPVFLADGVRSMAQGLGFRCTLPARTPPPAAPGVGWLVCRGTSQNTVP